MMIPKTVVLLLSGGLDSVCLLYYLRQQGCRIHALIVNYKQPHIKEIQFAKLHCVRLGVLFTVIDIPKLGGLADKTSWIVPNRNAILLSLAVNLAVQIGAESVTIGCNQDDAAGFPDCRDAFIQLFNTMLSTAEVPVEVCAPYLTWPKWKIARLASDMGVPSNEIWTCYKGGEKPCGECPACLKLKAAYA